MARHGLNCTLSYADGSGTRHIYKIRAGNLAYGVQMISAESAARTQRAYYPHKTAMQQFTVQALLKNWAERTDFTNWLSSYAAFALDPDSPQEYFPFMTVSVPLRNFVQYGVPLQGFQWGAHTGMMMFTPDIIFEAAISPGQSPTNPPPVSTVINQWSAFQADKAIQYFYPFGIQLSGNQQGSYAQVQYPGDPSQFNAPGPGLGLTTPPPPFIHHVSPTGGA
jgi:hypothetical protein